MQTVSFAKCTPRITFHETPPTFLPLEEIGNSFKAAFTLHYEKFICPDAAYVFSVEKQTIFEEFDKFITINENDIIVEIPKNDYTGSEFVLLLTLLVKKDDVPVIASVVPIRIIPKLAVKSPEIVVDTLPAINSRESYVVNAIIQLQNLVSIIVFFLFSFFSFFF